MGKTLRAWRKRRRERGQGMTEYIIIVALVAIGTIALVTLFGDNVRALFATSANALAGEGGVVEGESMDDRSFDKKKKLDDFAEDAF